MNLDRTDLLDETFLENIILNDKLDRHKLDNILNHVNLDIRSLPGGEYGRPDLKANITWLDATKI